MKLYKVAVLFVIALVSGCGGPSGSGFEGKWKQKIEKSPSSLIIKKDGEVFHIDYISNNPWLNEYENKKLEASVVSDSVLTIIGSMGIANLRLEEGHIFFDDGEYTKSD